LPPAADHYAVINVTVDAATDHEIAGSSAFPNFDKGAVDNYYTLAHSAVDNSPSAEGTASPADSGPLGQTVAAGGSVNQPQYADSRWPGDSTKSTAGNQGGPYAAANAGPFSATATSSEASGPGSSGSAKSSKSAKSIRLATPKGFSRRLHRALVVWKATWLPKLHLKLPGVKTPRLKLRVLSAVGTQLPTTPSVTTPSVTVPTLTPTVPTTTTTGSTSKHKKKHKHHKRKKGSSPPPSSSKGDGQGLFESTTSAGFDPSGAMLAAGESSLASVSIGNGQIVLQGLDTAVSVTNHGKPGEKLSVTIAGATIGGVPVTIDDHGVHVAGQGAALPYGQADDALNSALKQAGIQIYTVKPQIKKSRNEVAITAAALDVSVAQQVAPSGVPAQYAEHRLAEVFVDSLATPGTPPGFLGLGVTGGGVIGGGTTGAIGGGSTSFGSSSSGGGYSSSSSPVSSTAGSTGSSFLTSLTSKPLWLLLTYFLWQSIVIGTGASLWYWRQGGWST
jgi:hypothetical protein